MTAFLSNVPLAITSLMLTLFSLANLLSDFPKLSGIVYLLATLLLSLITGRLLLTAKTLLTEFENPVVASSFASFFMSLFVFITTLPFEQRLKIGLWGLVLISYLIYIVWFSYHFIPQKNLDQIYPSWFVLYVGLAISIPTSPSNTLELLHLPILMVSSLAWLILFVTITYRQIKNPLSLTEKPLLAIYAAPLSLLLTAYLKLSPSVNHPLILGALLFSQLLYLFALVIFFKQIRNIFSPIFSAFSFPLVGSVGALKASLPLFNYHQAILILYTVELLLVITIICFLTYNVFKFFRQKSLKILHTSIINKNK
ncbi:ethanolamine utilization protein EutJ [Streptococcus sp. SGI.013]|uniref:SLAC1 family transporter n=1 Tax=unclassified Streptococcus TaxID=2608887 RepID=UPI003D090986